MTNSHIEVPISRFWRLDVLLSTVELLRMIHNFGLRTWVYPWGPSTIGPRTPDSVSGDFCHPLTRNNRRRRACRWRDTRHFPSILNILLFCQSEIVLCKRNLWNFLFRTEILRNSIVEFLIVVSTVLYTRISIWRFLLILLVHLWFPYVALRR